MGHVFISYSHDDQAYVVKLAAFLNQAGFVVWYDYEIDAGESFGPRIQRAIDECAVFVPILSPAATGSKWVVREIGYADQLEKPILPLLLAPCSKPIEVSSLQHEDVAGGRMPPTRFLDQLRRSPGIATVAVSEPPPGPAAPARSQSSPAGRRRRPTPSVAAEPADIWAATGMRPLEVALPKGVGYTLRAYSEGRTPTQSTMDGTPLFLAEGGQLLLFREKPSLVAFVRAQEPNALQHLKTWPTLANWLKVEHVNPADDDVYELDLVVENIRGGADALDPALLIKARELANDVGFSLKIAAVVAALATGSPLDDFDEALRALYAGGFGATLARRRLHRMSMQQTALAWRTIIGKIASVSDLRD